MIRRAFIASPNHLILIREALHSSVKLSVLLYPFTGYTTSFFSHHFRLAL